MSELTVILKDEHRTYRHKFLMYEPIHLGVEPMPENLVKCIHEAKQNFDGEPEEIMFKITFQVQ